MRPPPPVTATAAALEERARSYEDGPEGMTLTALREAGDLATAEVADAAGTLLGHMITTGQLPAELAVPVALAAPLPPPSSS